MVWMACSWLCCYDGSVELPLILRKKRCWAMTLFYDLNSPLMVHSLGPATFSVSSRAFFFFFFALSRRNDPCLCLSLMTFCDALSWHFHFNKLWIFHHVMQSPLHKFKDAETPESFRISLMFITCCCINNLLNLFLQINSSYIFEKVYLIHEAFMAHLV